MSAAKHTEGPWVVEVSGDGHRAEVITPSGELIARCAVPFPFSTNAKERDANAHLIAAAPTQHAEMLRYLPVLERLEADPEAWERFTTGTGIATLNGYRAAIAAAKGEA